MPDDVAVRMVPSDRRRPRERTESLRPCREAAEDWSRSSRRVAPDPPTTLPESAPHRRGEQFAWRCSSGGRPIRVQRTRRSSRRAVALSPVAIPGGSNVAPGRLGRRVVNDVGRRPPNTVSAADAEQGRHRSVAGVVADGRLRLRLGGRRGVGAWTMMDDRDERPRATSGAGR